MSSSLEDLPDEILLEIFYYLSPSDLFLCFADLNHRLNSILCDQSIRFATRVTERNSRKINPNFLQYFAQISVCYDQIDLHQFSNLRSLTLGPSPRPTDDLLTQLVDRPLKYFPHLIQLTVYQPLSTWYSPPAIRLWTQIFTNQFSSKLKRCSLVGRIFAIPTTCFYCRSLRGLAIGGCSLRDLPALLSALPNLKYLSTDLWGTTDRMSLSSYQHFNLAHFTMKFTQQTIVLEEIRCLLSYTPNLTSLFIEGSRKHDCFQIEYWSEVLNSQLEYLKNFFCTIRLSDTIENETLDIDYIQNYHRLFSQLKLFRRNDSLFISNQ